MLNSKDVSWKRFGSCQLVLPQCPDQQMTCVQPIPVSSMHQANTTPASLLSPSHTQHHLLSPPPDSPGSGVHVLSFMLWKHHSNKFGLFRWLVFFFFQNSKETPNQKRHKYTNSCVLGPVKRSNCFVKWMWPGLVTWTESSPSLVLFGFINIAQVARILFNLHRDGRRHICDTLLKFLRALEPAKVFFISLFEQNKC